MTTSTVGLGATTPDGHAQEYIILRSTIYSMPAQRQHWLLRSSNQGLLEQVDQFSDDGSREESATSRICIYIFGAKERATNPNLANLHFASKRPTPAWSNSLYVHIKKNARLIGLVACLWGTCPQFRPCTRSIRPLRNTRYPR